MKELQDSLDDLRNAVFAPVVDAPEVASQVRNILLFLMDPHNDTDENCTLVNNHVLLNILTNNKGQARVALLPEPLQGVLQDMGMTLHDTHGARQVAENFDSTPQQLYARLEADG